MARKFSALPEILEKRKKEATVAVDLISTAAALEAGRVAIKTTRVDTGKARSNWVATTSVPSNDVIPPYVPGNKRGIQERANASRAENQHNATATLWKPSTNQPFFITNNAEHIGFLNFGSSTTSADNMLAKAALAWRNFFVGKRNIKLFRK